MPRTQVEARSTALLMLRFQDSPHPLWPKGCFLPLQATELTHLPSAP